MYKASIYVLYKSYYILIHKIHMYYIVYNKQINSIIYITESVISDITKLVIVI